MAKNTLGKKVKRLRLKKKWTLRDLCRAADLPSGRETILRIEEGLSKPGNVSVKTLIALTDTFPELTVDDFRG